MELARTNSIGKRTCVAQDGVDTLTKEEAGESCVLIGDECQDVETFKANVDKANVDKTASSLARALLAEALGTGLIVLFGCGSVLSSFSGVFSGVGQIAAVWGIGVALAIFATAEVSGAHLNPAITLAFLLVRPAAHAMTPRKAGLYMASQLAGAVAAGALNLALHGATLRAFERAHGITRGAPESVLSASGFGEYFPNPGLSAAHGAGPYEPSDVTPGVALLVEAWGTCVLAFVIFALTHPRNPAAAAGDGYRPAVPALIGATVAVLLCLYAPLTQAGWNPARDFGPRLVAAMAGWGAVAIPGPRGGFWVYILGPFLGAPVGAFVAERVLWK